jgi:hypothetical protein
MLYLVIVINVASLVALIAGVLLHSGRGGCVRGGGGRRLLAAGCRFLLRRRHRGTGDTRRVVPGADRPALVAADLRPGHHAGRSGQDDGGTGPDNDHASHAAPDGYQRHKQANTAIRQCV